MNINECPYLDGRCGHHGQCVKCEMIQMYIEQRAEVGYPSLEVFSESIKEILEDRG